MAKKNKKERNQAKRKAKKKQLSKLKLTEQRKKKHKKFIVPKAEPKREPVKPMAEDMRMKIMRMKDSSSHKPSEIIALQRIVEEETKKEQLPAKIGTEIHRRMEDKISQLSKHGKKMPKGDKDA